MRKPTRRSLAVAGAALVALALALAVPRLMSWNRVSAAELKKADVARAATGTPKQRFAKLSRQHTNQCGPSGVDLDKIAVRGRLQGSCCKAMVYDRYVQQVSGLHAYAAVNEIPADAYDIPVSLAKRLTGYSDSIKLSTSEQAVYGRAVKRSDEHGPCCCHCWRWKAFQGQAMQLIVRRQFTAAQVARVWNLEDGCGGG